MKNNFPDLLISVCIIAFVLFASCTKTASNPGNSCNGSSVQLNFVVTEATPCENPNGSITISATGSTGFSYKLDDGSFQASPVFNNLAVGSYSILVRDANGCMTSGNVTVAAVAAGPLYTQVRGMMQGNCAGCHNNSQTEGGMNWTVDCNLVSQALRIKARAVDSDPSPMPPTGLLPVSERDKITAWINAGARYTD